MIYLGTTELSMAYVGTTELEAIYVGSTSVWENYINQGIDKDGNQTGSAFSWVTVTGWTIRSGYPGTTITTNGLTVVANKPVTIYAQTLRGEANTGNQVRLYNVTAGAVLATGTAGGIAPSVTHTFTPSVNTHIQLQSYAQSTLNGRHVVQGGSESYMTAVKA